DHAGHLSISYIFDYWNIYHLVLQSSDIIEGIVLGVNTAWLGGEIYTSTRVRVDRSYKGTITSSTVTLTDFGGSIGGFTMDDGYYPRPRYKYRDEVLVFVRADNDTLHSTLARNQGMFLKIINPDL
ncbi:hypothetical protein ACFLZR_02230, partial [Candidatus Neomarinimicrobiota bacterium]